jgi:hypothetical protein
LSLHDISFSSHVMLFLLFLAVFALFQSYYHIRGVQVRTRYSVGVTPEPSNFFFSSIKQVGLILISLILLVLWIITWS